MTIRKLTYGQIQNTHLQVRKNLTAKVVHKLKEYGVNKSKVTFLQLEPTSPASDTFSPIVFQPDYDFSRKQLSDSR